MGKLMDDIIANRTAEPLENLLEKDGEFQECRRNFFGLFRKLQEKLSDSRKMNRLLEELNQAVNGYACSYGKSAYCLGFHDGMDMGIEHVTNRRKECETNESSGISLEDMIHLVYIMDAYRELNIAFCGEEMMLGFDEGCIGSLSRVYKVIAHNVCAQMRENDFAGEDKVLLDTSLSPEERARRLLGNME